MITNIETLTPAQLRRAADIQELIQKLEVELTGILDVKAQPATPAKGRGMSAAGRAKITAAQKARWAKAKGKEAASVAKAEPKRTLSPAARKKIAEAAKKRWAKAKAAGKKSL